jgi:Xaa-Pro aminopeptidase
MLIDNARLSSESWLDTITPYAPIPGLDMLDIVVSQIKGNGWDKAVIGVELGHSPRGNTGYLFATEYEFLLKSLPEATFVNSLEVMDRASYIKEPEEILLLRQASAITDAGMERVMESLYVGISETEIAGIGEMELRRLGSEYHWAVTGSSEVASGYRATFPSNGTTQPTQKIVQKGENIIVDLHSCYHQYLGDLAHNFILGQPTREQQKLAEEKGSLEALLKSRAKLHRLVRDEIGAVAAFRLVDVVPALPKTRSGKILRKTLRGIAAGRDEPVPSTIEDPGVLDTLAPILRS